MQDYLNYAKEDDKKDIIDFLNAAEAVPVEERLTFREVKERITKYNEENGITYANCHSKPAIRFRGLVNPIASKFKGTTFGERPYFYSPINCTYEFTNCEKYWFNDLCGRSLYSQCIDKYDSDHNGIRLDNYIGSWEFFYFYEVKN